MSKQFCSRGQFNNDPEPLVHPSGRRSGDDLGFSFGAYFEYEDGQSGPFGQIAKATYDPRPEYLVPQTNLTNPILREVRYGVNDKRFTLEEAFGYYSRPGAVPATSDWWYTSDQLMHARLVLSRLVRIRDSLAPVFIVVDEDEDEWETEVA